MSLRRSQAAVYLVVLLLYGAAAAAGISWRAKQIRAASLSQGADEQWRQVLKIDFLVHGGGVTQIERQIADPANTSEYRQYLRARLPVWEYFLLGEAAPVDAVVEEFKTDPPTLEELARRQRILDDLELRVLMPWIEIARVFPVTRREEES